ncbi:MAG: hypothetical protein IKN67_00675 [Alphaproteobacteria bacterium]|nr:hypothetical protein [Alphaproteobacteria bacterium]
MITQKYLNKKGLLRRGYSLRSDGILYKKSVLEKYYDEGYLNLPESPFSDEDRFRAGQRIAFDYYMANKQGVKSSMCHETNIATTGSVGIDVELYYKERYLRAIKSVPEEFWGVVRSVCIEDKELKVSDKYPIGTLLNKNNKYHQKMLLCLGLERLAKFYLQKNKKSS